MKRLKSFLVRADPSEIFDGIDTAALLNWLVKPKISSFGKVFVNEYIFMTKSIAFL